jgi:RimJ/RimL family protein N-acetyltransferase
MKLATNRLILREFETDDFLSVHAYASEIDNVKYMIWGPNDEKATESFINNCIQWQNESPRLKYDFLHKSYWKQGYMPEAAKALLSFGFNKLKLHRMFASCNAENYGSYRVMEKCGMLREAHFIKNRHGRKGIDAEWLDEYIYAILDSEWCKVMRQNGV